MSLRRLLDTEFLSIKKKDALQMIKKDRQKYSKVYEIIETFAKNKKLITISSTYNSYLKRQDRDIEIFKKDENFLD
jgi:tRNA U34 5-carboxymethylaminomethyl modifying enzyme MnmG/GidA